MKLKYLLTTILLVTSVSFSCNEGEWLKEKPLDFYAPENSFSKPADFYSALALVYQEIQGYYHKFSAYEVHLQMPSDMYLGAFFGSALTDYKDGLTPEYLETTRMWNLHYRVIFDCNAIINRIEGTNAFADENERIVVKAEAMFLRGFMYRLLGIFYGGVPIVLEEISAPKRDFVRASREKVWEQVISDYTFAAQNLPTQSALKVDGRVTKGAAQHALTEIYLITKEWDKAIASASEVINNPDYALMTQRFGTWKDKPGDVYGDLFRRGNVNYRGKAGTNKEAIWVSQIEYLKPGGEQFNRINGIYMPMYWALVGNDGKNLFIGPTVQNGGRGSAFGVATDYLLNKVWTDPNDIRSSQYNIIRDVKADNPKSAYYGQYIVASGAFTNFDNQLNRWWSAIFTKTTPINDFPPEVILDPATGKTSNMASRTYNDTYYFRLAETYLLRAEAYLGKGDLVKAAADINTVRARAGAAPVSPSEVDIYYILNERARELCFEELRVLTLLRLGLQKELVDKYNPVSAGYIEDKHKLWPIPQSEIERNTEAVLEQNPGYN